MVVVEFDNLSDYLMDKVQEFKRALPTHLEKYLQSREFEIKREYEIGYNDSGLLRRSGELANATVVTGYFTFSGGAGVTIGNPLNYAGYMEFGTQPHVIKPKNAAALHFYVGGQEIFAKSVQHPGTRPYSFMEKGTDFTVKMLENGIGDYLRAAFTRT